MHAKFNVYRYLSILVNFLDKVQSHGVYIIILYNLYLNSGWPVFQAIYKNARKICSKNFYYSQVLINGATIGRISTNFRQEMALYRVETR
jgi:hypothetical protein